MSIFILKFCSFHFHVFIHIHAGSDMIAKFVSYLVMETDGSGAGLALLRHSDAVGVGALSRTHIAPNSIEANGTSN